MFTCPVVKCFVSTARRSGQYEKNVIGLGQIDELREPHLRKQRRQELHINKIKYISPCAIHFCSSNYNNIISVNSDTPFFTRSFHNALSGQPRVYVNYRIVIF